MIDDPVRLLLENSTRGVHVYWLILHQCSISFLRIFFRSMKKETRGDGLSNSIVIASAAHHI